MSAKKNTDTKQKIQQTAILDDSNNAEETDVVTTAPIQTDSKTKETPIKETPKKSRRKMSLEEFSVINNLRPEVKAGFKVWLNGEYFHFEKEWEELFDKYMNRTIKIK